MRRFLVSGLLPALACLAAPAAAHAQLGGINLGAAFGSTSPSGDIRSGFNSGYHVQGLAALSLPLVPIGFRGELAFDHMRPKASNTSTTGPLELASGVVDATFSVPFPIIHPYAIGGVGYYVHNGSIGTREGRIGFNGGVGVEIKLPLIRAFGEARYHSIGYPGTRVAVIPLTVGFIF